MEKQIKKLTALLFVAATMLLGLPLRAQTLIESYRFSTDVDTTKWIDISDSATIIATDANGESWTTTQRAQRPIGFTFRFAGIDYTTFSLNVGGVLRFGEDSWSYRSNYLPLKQNSGIIDYCPKVVALGDEGYASPGTYAKYAVVGDSGSRVLVVEMTTSFNRLRFALVSFQIQLFEGTNEVRLVYGSTNSQTSGLEVQIGMAASSDDACMIDVPADTLMRSTTGFENCSPIGAWPEVGRWYAFEPDTDSYCPIVTNVVVSGSNPDSVTISWDGVPDASGYLVSIPDADISFVVNDTVVTLDGFNGGMVYHGTVTTECMYGTASLSAAPFTFTTDCGEIVSLPWRADFNSAGLRNCWTILSYTGDIQTAWFPYCGWPTGDDTWMASRVNYSGPNNDWLISPVMTLPSGDGIRLEWDYWCNLSGGLPPEVEVRLAVYDNVSDTVVDTAMFDNLLTTVNMIIEGAHLNNITHETHLATSLDAWAGERVRLAFVNSGPNGAYAMIDNVELLYNPEPQVTITAPVTVHSGDTVNLSASLTAGSSSGVQYNWYSDMVNEGWGTLTAISDQATVIYTTGSIDRIIVEAITSYGTAYDTVNIDVVDCDTVQRYPWFDGFNHGLECYTKVSNSSLWSIYNGYLMHSSGVNYTDFLVSQPISIPENASEMRMELDLRFVYGYNSDNFTLLIAPASTNNWFTVTPQLTVPSNVINTQRFSVNLDSFAGQTIRFALYADGRWLVDNLTLRMAQEPVTSIDIPFMVWTGDTVVGIASLAEGSTDGLSHLWNSTMVNQGLATVITDTDTLRIVYHSTGIDTIEITTSNSYGTTVDSLTVQVCPAVDTIPWELQFITVGGCWAVLSGYWYLNDYNHLESDGGSETWIYPDSCAITSPTIVLPMDSNLWLEWDTWSTYATYALMATTGDYRDLNLYDTLLSDSTRDFSLQNYHHYRVSLAQYAGQRIHLAFFRYDDHSYESGIAFDNLHIFIDSTIVIDTIPEVPDTVWRTMLVVSDNESMGSVTGGGIYPDSSLVTISATPFEGYRFDSWNDGDTNAVRTLLLVSDTTFTAYFAPDTMPVPQDTIWRTVTVTTNVSGATETYGSGLYQDGDTVEIGYRLLDSLPDGGHWQFLGWDDGGMDNPRDIVVTSDTAIVALFEWVADSTEGINELSIFNSQFSIYPNPASMTVTVETDQPSMLTLTDATGRKCGQWRVDSGKTTLDISPLPAGVYFVRLAGSPAIGKLIVR